MPEPKWMLDNPDWGPVRWGGIPADGVLRLAEGIEDAASLMNLLGAGFFRIAGAENRVVSGDRDFREHPYRRDLQPAWEGCARYCTRHPAFDGHGRRLVIGQPPRAGDWNGLLREALEMKLFQERRRLSDE